MPRWHQDGYFYAPFAGDQHKAALTLKGTGTLFNNFPQELRDEFNKYSREARPDDLAAKKKLLDLVDTKQNETAEAGQGSVFIVGSGRGAIHSEPPIHSERLFMSVLPGSKAQIEELRDFWKSPPTTYSPGQK